MSKEKELKVRTEGRQEKAHENMMSGLSYDINDPILKLKIAASSCFFGEPQFYHSDPEDTRPRQKSPIRSEGSRNQISEREAIHLRKTMTSLESTEWQNMSPAELLESAIDAALDHDPEATLQEAVRLRQEAFIRTTPSVILVRAANHPKVKGTELIRKYAKKIIDRPDEISNSLAYHLHTYAETRKGGKRPIPNALKRAYDDAFHRFTETQLAKYRNEKREVSLIDAVNLTYGLKRSWEKYPHELTNSRIPESIKKLVGSELKVTGKTWEAIRSAEGATKESWEKSIDKMGHMALLRNIRGMLEDKVDPELFVDKLIGTAATGKQMPFRYLSAYNEVKKISPPARILDAIEECLELSIGNLPRFEGRTMILSDNSGSAEGSFTSSMGTMSIAEIGNMMGVLTGKASDEGYLGIFGDRLEKFEIRKKSSVFDQVAKAKKIGGGIGGATENGIWMFFDEAIKQKEHWDSIFVYSDMQAGHGGLYGLDQSVYKDYQWLGGRHIDVPLLIETYRERVNPNVDVFLVQIAGGTDALIPEWYFKTYILGGWSDEVLRFARQMKDLI